MKTIDLTVLKVWQYLLCGGGLRDIDHLLQVNRPTAVLLHGDVEGGQHRGRGWLQLGYNELDSGSH